jgi:outer membrane lipoprotein-sorting protein
MKKYIFIAVMCVGAASANGARNWEDLLRKSDEKMFPRNASYELIIEVENDDGRVSTHRLVGYKKGSAKNIIVVREPKKNAGTVEMRRDNSIWVYFNTNGKTMKSAFQSLAIGEDVCYGDILTSDLSYDYAIESMNTEKDTYLFILRPKPGHEGYAKLVVTIDKNSLIPKSKEYYALSGTLLKKCEIVDVESDGNGIIKKFRQKFYDPLKERKSFVTVDMIRPLGEGDVPERYFNETQMKFVGR